MVKLLPIALHDPNLAAAEDAIVLKHTKESRRTYLGMSSIGDPCSRRLWYSYHNHIEENYDAATIMRFEDGHRSEDLMAQRLKATDGISLVTSDDSGNQFEVQDFEEQFKGHLDGIIWGLIQAPNKEHVWEGKCVNEKKFKDFLDIKAKFGEKNTLAKWDEIYYAQAQAYMGYTGINRHYLTVCTPGGRRWEAVRTEFDQNEFDKIRDKAKRILNAKIPLAKLSNDPNWFQCKWCNYWNRCHGNQTLSTRSNRLNLQLLSNEERESVNRNADGNG